ncbi:MAG: hypothetical protein K8R23_18130 [Chthoniobacter sp.]|nr:hypothetical protein [Chthoniobacter sp.]
MSLRFLYHAAVVASLALSGCANFSQTELAEVRQHHVAPEIMSKMERGHVLTLAEVTELTRRGVPDRLIIRQIDNTGLDYTLAKDDVVRLRKAGVAPAVIDALMVESDRFARNYVAGFGPHYVSPYDDVTYGPDPYRYTGDAAVGVGFSSYQGPRTYDPYVWRR